MTELPEKPAILARRARPLLIAALCFAIGALLLTQGLDAGSPSRDLLRRLLEEVQTPYWGGVYVMFAFAFGTVVFAPITAMFVATCLTVDVAHGVAYCFLGGLLSASISYAIGLRFGARFAHRLQHKAIERLRAQVATRPVRAVLVARFLPVGNFTIINLVLGSLHVRYGAFVVGNILGMTPGILAITLFKELLEEALHRPDLKHWVSVGVGGLGVAGMLYFVSRRLTQRRALASPDED